MHQYQIAASNQSSVNSFFVAVDATDTTVEDWNTDNEDTCSNLVFGWFVSPLSGKKLDREADRIGVVLISY